MRHVEIRAHWRFLAGFAPSIAAVACSSTAFSSACDEARTCSDETQDGGAPVTTASGSTSTTPQRPDDDTGEASAGGAGGAIGASVGGSTAENSSGGRPGTDANDLATDAGQDGSATDASGASDPVDGGTPELADDGAASEPGIGVLGEDCAPDGSYACRGHAQRGRLVCFEGQWTLHDDCASDERCDTRDENLGYCEPVVAECDGMDPGAVVCIGSSSVECGSDLVDTRSIEDCPYLCSEGACTGECNPEATRCNGNAVETCDVNGAWTPPDPCPSDARYCADGACTSVPPSCQGLAEDCGPSGDESCCTSPLVTGGSFYRSYDGVDYTDKNANASVSDFRLDRFEVTVGRFRNFKTAWDGGWRPAAGSGKHTHLDGGKGLYTQGTSGNEPGWDAAWASDVVVDDGGLDCDGSLWTPSPGANETRAMNCLNWYAAYAFCIWDGGFLPSDAEWNYAAAGGSEQRVYPWSNPPTSSTIDCSYASYGGEGCLPFSISTVGAHPKGDGYWGQADLAGNVAEWALDWYNPYSGPANDSADFTDATQRVTHGGYLSSPHYWVVVAYRYKDYPDRSFNGHGVRCAREP